jgi:ABC-2 type transport system permease protein
MSDLLTDLSYRSGAAGKQSSAWKAIARNTFQINMKKRGLWILASFSGWWYAIMLITIYVMDQMLTTQNRTNWAFNVLTGVKWNDQVAHALGFGQIFVLFMALMCGAGAIANDNRSNALLVYLSKPCTKKDYLLGKWVGVFLSLLVAAGTPHLVFYVYAGLSYADLNFFKYDPWLILRLAAAIALLCAFYTSLVLGISSLQRQGRIAGAIVAALYFLSNIFTIVIQFVIMSRFFKFTPGGPGPRGRAELTQTTPVPDSFINLFYSSIDGLVNGASRILLNFGESNWALWGGGRAPAFREPSALFAFGAMFLISAACLGIAWKRIQAVEVIG